MSSFPLTFTHIFQDGHIAPPTGFMCLFMGKDCWVSQSNLSSRWLKPPTSHVPCLLIPYPSVHDTPVKCTGLHEGPVSWGGYFKLGWWDWKQWSIHLLSEFIYDYIYVYIHDIYVYIYTHYIYIYTYLIYRIIIIMIFLEYIFCFFFVRWIFPYHPGAPGTRGLDTSAGHGAGSQSFGGPEASGSIQWTSIFMGI